MRPIKLALLIASLTLLVGQKADDAHAQTTGSSPKQTARVRAIIALLTSADPSEVREGYLEMERMGTKAVPAVTTANDVLARGLTAELAAIALRSLATVGQESSSRVIRPYLHHRQVELRREAVRALMGTKGQVAKDGLRRALSDRDAEVRGMAATGLGELGAAEHVDALLVALDQGVLQAAASVGKLCSPDQCEGYSSRMDKVAFEVMASGFEPILFREAKQMPDDQKIRVVERVRDVGTEQAREFLRDVRARWPRKGSQAVRRALDQALLSTDGSPGGDP